MSLDDVHVIYAALYTPDMATHGAPGLVPRPCCTQGSSLPLVTTIPAFVVSVVQFVCNLILFQLDLHVKNRKFSTETKSTPSSSSPEG